MKEKSKTRILFVCMGNICRSPLAECAFLSETEVRGLSDHFEIDSAGTGGWHAGQDPDRRMQKAAEAAGIDLFGSARQVRREDFAHFEHIVCMDEENRQDLLAMGAPKSKLSLLLEYDSSVSEREVPDPYYGGESGFRNVVTLVSSGCQRLLDHLTEKTNAKSDG